MRSLTTISIFQVCYYLAGERILTVGYVWRSYECMEVMDLLFLDHPIHWKRLLLTIHC